VVQEGITQVLEGEFRPTHFRGVLTIVCKLLNVVAPDRAYFGRKDFQQTVVVRRMVEDLNMPVEVRVMPTMREPDGLAMSSRNAYLNEEERRQALCLHRALMAVRELYAAGERNGDALCRAMQDEIAVAPLARADYMEVVDGRTLEPLPEVRTGAVAVLAVRVGGTRLIDNMRLTARDEG
jgi:pantoate--beta-alanine ligase